VSRALALVAVLSFAPPVPAEDASSPWSRGYGFRGLACSAAAIPTFPSAYYGIDMVPTKRVPGTGSAEGVGKVTFAASPYGVSVSSRGTYVYDISLGLRRLKRPKQGFLTAWVAKSDLTEVERLGVLDENLELSGRVEWNKFLLVVTLESESGEKDLEAGERWLGPVVTRGMSRSGMMHTLAGHGPFEKEPCAKYGFR
jgi:hypothetical protein